MTARRLTRDASAETKHEAFKRAYEEVPSQDNEGYIPDRAGFKSGFFRAWDARQAEIDAMEAELAEVKSQRDSLDAAGVQQIKVGDALSAARDSLRTEYAELQKQALPLIGENAKLKAEVELARERLGPAGYKILQDFLILQTRVSELEAALKAVRTDAIAIANEKREYVISGWAMDKVDEALAKLREKDGTT